MRKKGNYWVMHYETGKWLVAQWCAGEWSTLESNSEVYDDEFWTFIDENRIDDERPSCRVVTDITDY